MNEDEANITMNRGSAATRGVAIYNLNILFGIFTIEIKNCARFT